MITFEKGFKGKKQLNDKIKSLVNRRVKDLYLEDWDIFVKFSEDTKNSDGGVVAGTTNAQEVYTSAIITFYAPCFNVSDSELNSLVTHELVHCVVARYQSAAENRFVTESESKDAMENLVQKFASIVIRLDR